MLTNFRTYQLAVELYQRCQQLSARSYVRDQLMRGSLSTVLNIAEGSAKPTAKDRKRFYAISLGSLREVQAILTLLRANREFEVADQLGACLYRLARSRN